MANYIKEKLVEGYKGKFVIHLHKAQNTHFDLRLEFPVESLRDSLQEYHEKRVFDKTKEPKPKFPDKPGNVLRSWAIPKHKMPTDKPLLATETEDHNVAYGSFEGTIPEGEYGAGTVEIYDKGTFELVKVEYDKKYVIKMNGEKVKGYYALIKTSGKKFLLIKVKNTEEYEKKASKIVPNEEVYVMVQKNHNRQEYFIEGDISKRLDAYDNYELKSININLIDLEEWNINEDYVDTLIKQIEQKHEYLPIVLSHDFSIIDGIHRANALKNLGYSTIDVYIGVKAKKSYINPEMIIKEAIGRYSKGDRVLYQDQKAIIEEVIPYRDVLSWKNKYKIKLENGKIISDVYAKELKLEKRLTKKITFKKMNVPSGWSFSSYQSSNFYDYQFWSFKKENDSVTIYRFYNGEDKYQIKYALNRTEYHETEIKDIADPQKAEDIAYRLMEKIGTGEIKPGFQKQFFGNLNPLIVRRDYGIEGHDVLEQQALALEEEGKLPETLKKEMEDRLKPFPARRASIIDYPKENLCPIFWDITVNPPKLKKEVRDKIIHDLFEISNENFISPKEWIEEITLTGSITTNQYNADTDVDINVAVDYDQFRKLNPEVDKANTTNFDLRKYLRKIVYQLNGTFLGGSHPTKYFLIGKGHRLESDFTYDVLKDKWIKEPELVSLDFNPDKEFRTQKTIAVKVCYHIVDLMMSIKIALEDFKREENQETLLKIKKDCASLEKIQNNIKNLRKLRFKNPSPQLLGYGFSKNWEENNIIFKYLEKYGLKKPIEFLKQILSDNENGQLEKLID